MREHTLIIKVRETYTPRHADEEAIYQKSIIRLLNTISNFAELNVTRYFRGMDLTVSVLHPEKETA